MNNPLEDRLRYVRGRAVAAGLIFLVAIGGLGYRLWQLQFQKGQYYYDQAQWEGLSSIQIPAARGEILDSSGTVLARDVPQFAATLAYTPRPPDTAEVALLAQILNLDPSAIEAAAASLRQDRPFAPVVLRSGLTPAQYTTIAENETRLPGVDVVAQPIRQYPGIPGDIDPGPALAANILGYIQAGDVPGDVKGAYGVEDSFNTLPSSLHVAGLGLAGADGKEVVEVDPNYHPVRINGIDQPTAGNNVVLSIDAGLQAVTQRALEAQLAALRTRTFGSDGGPFPNAWWGAAAAIDVRTGQVLALASVPTFNPNVFAQGAVALKGSAAQKAFDQQFTVWNQDVLGKPFIDHAIYDPVAPGSTFKPITAIAALEHGVITPSEHLSCPPVIMVGNFPLHNWIPVWGGNLDLSEALGRSCDTYFYTVGSDVGIDAIDQVAEAFGLGQPTGQIALQGENPGSVSSPAYAQQHKEPFTLATTMQSAIGQGYNAFNVLEMADYIAALANGGTLYRPYFINAIQSPDGKVLWKQQPEIRNHIPLTPEIVTAIHQAMAAVTELHPEWANDGADSTFGTAYWPFYQFTQLTQQYLGRAITVAGKTGTAETGGSANDGWFVCFAPADNPEIAIVIHTENSGEGFVGGAPIAREMLDYYFKLDQAMWRAGKADQLIPPEVQQYFGLAADQHYPDWWGAPPQPQSAASSTAVAGGAPTATAGVTVGAATYGSAGQASATGGN